MQMKNLTKSFTYAAILMLAACLMGCSGCSNWSGKGGSRGPAVAQVEPSQPAPDSTPSEQPQDVSSAQPIQIAEHPIVNVYLENSGSMNGYVENGQTSFQMDVFSYLTHVKHSQIPSEMNLHFINSRIIKINSLSQSTSQSQVIKNFISNLTSESFKTAGGSTATTDIANIFERVLSKTNDNTVSIFISDCIFSPGAVQNPTAYLAGQQTGIMDCVADYIAEHKHLAMLVYQLYSDFNGKYYYYKGPGFQYRGQRPYYIWVIGHPDNVAKLKKAIPNERFKGSGVANMWCAHNAQIGTIPYNIYPMAVAGDFDISNNCTITRMRKNSQGEFAFRILANMEQLEVLLGNQYLMDTNNYSRLVSKEDDEQWFIEIARNTSSQTKVTHNITLKTTGNISKGMLNVNLRCNTPQWAYDLTDMDDTSLTEENRMKTYGLKYIFDGITEAFIAKKAEVYATMSINIK